MQRNGNDPSVEWSIAPIACHAVPGIGWRAHMSKISAEIGAALAGSRTANNRRRIDDVIDEAVWIRRMQRDARELEVEVVEVTV